MKIYKFLLSIAAAAMLFTSCDCEEIIAENSTTPAVEESCPTLTITTPNAQTYELDPSAETTMAISVSRTTKNAASYAIKVLKNEGDVFVFPETVSFSEGQTTTDVVVEMKKTAETGKSFDYAFTFADDAVNPYVASPASFYGKASLVKWNELGTGTLYDMFMFASSFPVKIYQRDDKPSLYRFTNPYTDDVTGGGGSYFDMFEVEVNKDGFIFWNTFDYNKLYDVDAPIYGYYPSDLSTSQAANDELSYVTYNEDGSIHYFTITPYWYVPALGGGFGCYPLYVVFPGMPTPEELLPEEEE